MLASIVKNVALVDVTLSDVLRTVLKNAMLPDVQRTAYQVSFSWKDTLYDS